MKKEKFFALMLSITMLAICILPVTTANAQSAPGDSSPETPVVTMTDSKAVLDYTKDIACKAFPEYANGVSMLAGTFTTGKNVTNTQVTGPAAVYTFNAWMQMLGSSNVMMINGIVLGIAPSYSHFVSYGSPSPASTTTYPTRGSSIQTGTLGPNGSARTEYTAGFTVSGGAGVRFATMRIYANNNMQIAFTCF